MSKKRDELILYITKQVVTYMDTPKSIRKEEKQRSREHWVTRWFGLMPFSMKITATNVKQAAKPATQAVVRAADRMIHRKWTKTT